MKTISEKKEILICVLTTVLLFIVSIECSNCPAAAVNVCNNIDSTGKKVFLSGVTSSDNTSYCQCTAKIKNGGSGFSDLEIAANKTISGSCNEYLQFTVTGGQPKTFSPCYDNVTNSKFSFKPVEELKIILVHPNPTPSFTFCLAITATASGSGQLVNIRCNKSQTSSSTPVTPVDAGNNGGGSTPSNNGGGVTSSLSPGNNGGGATSSNNGGGATSSNNGGGATSNNGGGATSPNNGGGATSPNNGGGTTSPNNGGGATSSNNGGGATSSNNGGGTTSSNNGGGTNTQSPPVNPGNTELGTNPSASALDESDLGIILGVIVVILLIIIIIVLFFCAKKRMKKKMKVNVIG